MCKIKDQRSIKSRFGLKDAAYVFLSSLKSFAIVSLGMYLNYRTVGTAISIFLLLLNSHKLDRFGLLCMRKICMNTERYISELFFLKNICENK